MPIELKQRFQQQLSRIAQRHAIGKIGSVLLAVPAACLALVLLGVSDVRRQENQIEADIRVIEQRVKISEQVLHHVIDQETGVRGYLLTHDRQFLEPYESAKTDLFPLLNELKEKSAATATPEQFASDQTLAQLAQQIAQRLAQAEAMLQFAQQIDRGLESPLFFNAKRTLSKAEADQLLQQLQQAKQATHQIGQTVDRFKAQQQELLTQRSAQLSGSRQFIDRVQLLGAFLSVLTYVGVVALFQALDHGMVQRDQEIQQTQETIQTLTNQLVDGVIMIDDHAQIISLNPAAEQILGYSSPTLTHRSLVDVLFASAALGIDPAAWVESKAQTGIVEPLDAQQSDGRRVPIELSISRIAAIDSKLIVLVRDVSERSRLTNALSDKVVELGELNRQMVLTNADLQRKNQSLETFVKAAAHDLKTPIRGIASLAQWLETDLDGSLTPETQASLRLINQRVLRMQAIADGLLSYASIDRWVARQAIVDTAVLVQDIARQIALPPRFELRIQGPMPKFKTPHRVLELVFEQLIRNAVDHHDRGAGVIEVIATAKAHCTEFIVRDDGPGIAAAYRDRVLQMFQVIDQDPDASENVGVGLALVHKAIQLVGGTLDLRSTSTDELGGERGLAVYFTWPFLEAPIDASEG